jgi:hypothetical protein
MTKAGLTRFYGLLTTRERLSLVLAADARGDETERQRLEDSAPPRVMHLLDHHWPLMVLQTL